MAFFESFTASIKQKWLDYYQVNRIWLELQMEGRSVRTPDGGRRPGSALILGVVNSLEPKLANLMVPFFKLNGDEDAIIEVLQLNFDPDIMLGNRAGSGEAGHSHDADLEVSGFLPNAVHDTSLSG
ncbi:MAG: DUF5331 domain-containing protein [Prochlorotrichaceae cyanobacterium]|jgi:hypothetical protein